MSQKKGAENPGLFETWIKSKTNQDFKDMAYRGSLNRTDMEQTLPFAKSVLTQNKTVKARLEKLEDDLRRNGVLGPKTKERKAEEAETKMYDAEKNARVWDKNRLQKLEQEVIDLKAKLKRYEELSEVIAEMGIEF